LVYKAQVRIAFFIFVSFALIAMRFKRFSIFLFSSFLIAFFVSCENSLETVNLITAKDKTPLLVEQDANIVYSDSSKTKFNLKSPQIENYGGDDPYQIFPKGLDIDFYDDSMHVNNHASANYAIRHEKTQVMEADNNVVVVNKKGDRLTTEQLFWNQGKHTIYTNKFVQIKTADEIMFGDGLQSNEDFSTYKILNIRGTITLNNNTADKK
jgi:LPS export ABC transporter protein LptC